MRNSRVPVFIAGFVLIGGIAVDSLRTYAASDNGGKEAFSQCAACHTTDGSAGVGPTLKGIVGRQSASVPGNAMPYAGMSDAAQRTALIAYLETLK